jgi:hypothetical protein
MEDKQHIIDAMNDDKQNEIVDRVNEIKGALKIDAKPSLLAGHRPANQDGTVEKRLESLQNEFGALKNKIES